MRTKSSTDLGILFFGAYRRQVLALLLLHPDESFHLRELARITNTQPGTLRRELTQLVEAGVLSREKMGNLVRYKADPACPIYDELRSIFKKTAGVADVLREALTPLSSKISAAFVYGSIASGAERRTSDIDVMIVGAASFEEVVQALHPCQEQLRREINPNVYSTADFKKNTRIKDSFVSRVLEGPKIFILGEENDLGQPGSNRKAETTQSVARRDRTTARRSTS
ncbi:MAG TPA: nucleotidyltransferase domain-containing protein [Burkholderiales bacterium]|jgi:predicted nucleotidyltransferase|nr:nucleotidyltransferase domain-containing protein [Burkholderiales bacterium]